MAKPAYSSRTIMLITIAVAIVLTVIIWPLSMIGKGDPVAGSADDALGRCYSVVPERRSTSDRRSAAAITAAAWSRPG